MAMTVAALAGGVGGAKLAHGLAEILDPDSLTVIVNTGDDFHHLGLYISPDVDTVTYTLAGRAHPQHGWGRAGETWQALSTLKELGGPDWFQLGDLDLGLHLYRTERKQAGASLSDITAEICNAWNIRTTILPMTDDQVHTIVKTRKGDLPFQKYFVAERCEPAVTGFMFEGIETAAPAPGVLEAIDAADLVVFCPSNPWVSIDPILAIRDLRSHIRQKPVVGVSPIIAGKTVKGPAARMYADLGIEPSALAVAAHYEDLLDGFVLDEQDASLAREVSKLGMRTLTTGTLMRTREDRVRLANEVLAFARAEVGA